MGTENFIDARTDAVGDTIEGSICVVGAGAAGLTLVRRLARSVPGVILIESGGFELDAETQSLYASQMRGLEYFDLTTSRLRYFGGTTNHWGGYCRAYDEIDFEARPSVGLPGWPVARTDLQPFIADAAQELGIRDPFLGPDALLNAGGIESDNLAERSSRVLKSIVAQIAQEKDIRFGSRYRDEDGASQNARAYLRLNALQIRLTSDAANVDRVECATLTGKRVTARARFFVLCCHATENARLMLTSNDIETQGVGNRFGHVGRYFMDHIFIATSKFVPSNAFPLVYNYSPKFVAAHSIDTKLGFSNRTTREYDLLQYDVRFVPVYAEPETARAFSRVRRDFMKPGDISFLRDVATLVADFSAIPGYVAARHKNYHTRPLYYELEHNLEQAPNPNSRVVISDRRDALGSLIADLDWQLAEPDYRSISVGQHLIGAELAALGWGRMIPEQITPGFVRSQVAGRWHNMGTTRMSATPSGGVVDSDCRVHGVSNLYIGGSSVFASAGATPTMMIIALALRLSEHLQRRLAL